MKKAFFQLCLIVSSGFALATNAQTTPSSQLSFHYYEMAKNDQVASVVELTCASLALYIDRNLEVIENKTKWSKSEKQILKDLNGLVESSFKFYRYKQLKPFKSFSDDVLIQIEKISTLDFSESTDFDAKWTEEEINRRRYIFFKKEIDYLFLLLQTELGIFSSQNLLTLQGVDHVSIDSAAYTYDPNAFLEASEIQLSDATLQLLGQADMSQLSASESFGDDSFEELRKMMLDNNSKLARLEEQMNAMRIDQLEWMDQQNKERDQMLQSQINDLKEMVIELVRGSGDASLAAVESNAGDISIKNSSPVANMPDYIDVYFDKGSTKLSVETQLVLSEVVDLILRMPQASVLITGMADKSGDETKNLILSQERASQVKRFFTQSGLKPDRFVIRYTGSSKSSEASTTDRKVRLEFVNQ
jgi:outer membrane protein OmpA-like peptidoglycan-associated protein